MRRITPVRFNKRCTRSGGGGTEDVISIMYCTTDCKGDRPWSVALLNFAFPFCAVANPTKGDGWWSSGARSCLQRLVGEINERRWRDKRRMSSEPLHVRQFRDSPLQNQRLETKGTAHGNGGLPERLSPAQYCRWGKFNDSFVVEGYSPLSLPVSS